MKRLFMRFPEGKAKAFTLSYDDGVAADIRFIGLCDKYGLRATFNINTGTYAPEDASFDADNTKRRLKKSEATELYGKGVHEVSTHGYTHPFFEKIPTASVCQEIIKDREILEEQFGCIIRGHAYPFGTFNNEVVQCLKDCGIAYARTVWSSYNFDIPTDWLRLKPTCHHDDARVMELVDRFISISSPPPKLFYLWGHTYEFGQNNNWEHIEEIFKKISGREDVWYATNIEIYEYTEAYNSLIFSVDMKYVKNPSATKVYFEFNNKQYSIDAGESICIE